MSAATITSKGQITIPRAVRDDLGVGAGDRLDFVRMADGNYAVVPATASVKQLKGLIARPRKKVSLADMQKAIEAGARRK